MKSKFKHTIVKQSNCKVRETIVDYKGVIIRLSHDNMLKAVDTITICHHRLWLTSYITENRKKPTYIFTIYLIAFVM